MPADVTDPRLGDRRRLSSIVAQEITKWIIAGKLPAGALMPSEAELCKQFNVSKPTLREAIEKLNVMGIVQVQQGKQTTVNPLNPQVLEGFFRYAVQLYPEGLFDMVELRRGIETEAAALAAKRMTDDERGRLNELSRRMRETMNSPAEYLSMDFDFHLLLVQASRNKLIEQTFMGIAEHVRYTQRICHRQSDMINPERNLQLHEKITAAVVGGNATKVRQLMFLHFENMMPFAEAIIRDKDRQVDVF